MPFQAQPSEKCTACGKTVYVTEKAVVEEKTDKKVYHKQCIRCLTCNKILSTGQYSSMDGQFWCKPHFKQLFATKGNYDEAFGKEKVTAKWDSSAAPTSPPTSFIPESSTAAEKEKKPTSEATASKFRQFREQSDADKCSKCGKTVYLAEKLLVEDKNEKRLFHKMCFSCTTCNLTLDLRSYGSFGGKIYCKNHLKEQQGTSLPSGGTVSTAPTSFIPASEEKKTEKSQTPDHISSKFKAQETDKCKACGKSVFATEKVTLADSFKQQSIYHKNCLKCSVCSSKLDVSNYGSANGVLFCQTHLKQFGKPEQAKGDYFVSPLANANPDYVPGPRDQDDQQAPDRDDRRQDQSDREERAQASDREDVGQSQERREESDRDEPKQESDSERQRPERTSSFSSTGRGSPAIERSSDTEREQARASPSLERKFESASLDDSSERTRSASRSESNNGEDDDAKRRDAERQRKREERQRQMEEEERKEEEERERRRRERERRLAEADTEGGSSLASSESSGGGDREAERERRRKEREEERKREEEERERQEEKRRQERENNRKAQEEEMKRELEEQEKKAEERRRKLAELKGDA